MGDDLSSRISRIRRKLAMNQADFAEALGVKQSTVSRWESGSTPDGLALANIARLAGEDVAMLASADFDGATLGPRLFVKGEVAAGVWREALELDRDEWEPYYGGSHIEAPTDSRFGLRVIGESMNEVYPAGTLLDCVSCIHADLKQFRTGQNVIVIRRRFAGDIEATVKQFFDDGEGGHWLVPRSSNPAFQQPISLDRADPDIEETTIIAVVRGSYRPEP